MTTEMTERARIGWEHPENRSEPPAASPSEEPTFAVRSIGLGRAFFGMAVAGSVGCILTLATVAQPLGAGDTVAAMTMLPLSLMLISIVNGWIAVNLFLGSGLKK
jgi:hypothetical protein